MLDETRLLATGLGLALLAPNCKNHRHTWADPLGDGTHVRPKQGQSRAPTGRVRQPP